MNIGVINASIPYTAGPPICTDAARSLVCRAPYDFSKTFLVSSSLFKSPRFLIWPDVGAISPPDALASAFRYAT